MRALLLCCAVLGLAAEGRAWAEVAAAPTIETGVCMPTRRVRCPSAQDLLTAANAGARQSPLNHGFSGARQLYAYAPGALYELRAAVGFVSVILLEPGEAVTAIAAGDTSRWLVSEASTEMDTEPRAIILVKPLAPNISTNIVIATDRRVYVVEARASTGAAYAAEIAWIYPAAEPRAEPNVVLNHAYRVRVMRGRRPAWTPRAVSDDGTRTFIEFDANVAASDLPPLFVLTGEGAELVNYRLEGRRYIVDRLFDRAELRIGARSPVIVRIEREGLARPAPARRGRP